MRALLEVDTEADLATAVLVRALMPLARSRCGRDEGLLDDLLSEVSVVIAEIRHGACTSRQAGMLSRLLNRAWGRTRRSRRPSILVPVDPSAGVFEVIPCGGTGPEDTVVDRVGMDKLRADLASTVVWRAGAVRAWNTAVTLAGKEGKTNAERAQLKWARRVLRQYLGPQGVE